MGSGITFAAKDALKSSAWEGVPQITRHLMVRQVRPGGTRGTGSCVGVQFWR